MIFGLQTYGRCYINLLKDLGLNGLITTHWTKLETTNQVEWEVFVNQTAVGNCWINIIYNLTTTKQVLGAVVQIVTWFAGLNECAVLKQVRVTGWVTDWSLNGKTGGYPTAITQAEWGTEGVRHWDWCAIKVLQTYIIEDIVAREQITDLGTTHGEGVVQTVVGTNKKAENLDGAVIQVVLGQELVAIQANTGLTEHSPVWIDVVLGVQTTIEA